MMQNVDGEALHWAGKRLATRPESRKLVIALSDGAPECGEYKSVMKEHLKNAVSDLKKARIGCIGVGIQSDSVENYYEDYVVFNSLADMPKGFLTKLKSVLQKTVPSA